MCQLTTTKRTLLVLHYQPGAYSLRDSDMDMDMPDPEPDMADMDCDKRYEERSTWLDWFGGNRYPAIFHLIITYHRGHG